MADELTESALRYHRIPRPGKIEVVPTKPLATQRDLSLAYSPGVAAACNEIVRDPHTAAELTGRANLVAVTLIFPAGASRWYSSAASLKSSDSDISSF